MAGSGKPVSQIRGARLPEKPVQQKYGSRKTIPRRGARYPRHKWDRSAAGIGGCVHVRSSTLIIPAHCVKVSIQSFTQPCLQRVDGKLVVQRGSDHGELRRSTLCPDPKQRCPDTKESIVLRAGLASSANPQKGSLCWVTNLATILLASPIKLPPAFLPISTDSSRDQQGCIPLWF